MNEAEVQKLKAKVEQAVGLIIDAFRKQDEKLAVPREIGQLSRDLTNELVDEVIEARQQEVDLAEFNLKGKNKNTDWKAYKDSRKKDIERTRKSLKNYTMKPNEGNEIPVVVGVDPSEGTLGNEGVS